MKLSLSIFLQELGARSPSLFNKWELCAGSALTKRLLEWAKQPRHPLHAACRGANDMPWINPYSLISK